MEAGLRLNVGTGLPYTRQLVKYEKFEQRLIDLRLDDAGARAVLPGPRNGARLPAYHRLDVSFRKTVTKGWGSLTPYLNVINVYNRDNVLWYQRHYYNGGLSELETHMLPILPTVGVEVSF